MDWLDLGSQNQRMESASGTIVLQRFGIVSDWIHSLLMVCNEKRDEMTNQWIFMFLTEFPYTINTFPSKNNWHLNHVLSPCLFCELNVKIFIFCKYTIKYSIEHKTIFIFVYILLIDPQLQNTTNLHHKNKFTITY